MLFPSVRLLTKSYLPVLNLSSTNLILLLQNPLQIIETQFMTTACLREDTDKYWGWDTINIVHWSMFLILHILPLKHRKAFFQVFWGNNFEKEWKQQGILEHGWKHVRTYGWQDKLVKKIISDEAFMKVWRIRTTQVIRGKCWLQTGEFNSKVQY